MPEQPITRRALLGATAAIAALPVAAVSAPATAGLVRFRLQATRPAARPGISIGHAFARGDVPAGTHVVLAGGSIPVQQDSENHWPDGSLRFARLSFLLPDSLVPGVAKSYALAVAPGEADRGVGLPIAGFAAGADFSLRVHGYDYGADSFTVGLSDILATMPGWDPRHGWGRDPVGGYRVTGAGPVCTTVHAWRYLKRDADGASHRWVRADLWATLFAGSREGDILAMLSQPNSYGPHPRGTVGATGSQPPHLGVAELWNGGKRVYSWGGPNDPRSGAVPAAAFDIAGAKLTKAAGWLATAHGSAVVLSGPGIPAGLPRDRPIWIAGSYYDDPGFCATRADTGMMSDSNLPPHKPGEHIKPGELRRIDGAIWRAVTAGITGAEAHSAGVLEQVADGSVTWAPVSLPMVRPGTGRATAMPLLATFPGAGTFLADAAGDPLPIGNRAAFMVAHDEIYLTRKTRLVPSYDLSIKRVLDGPALDHGPYQPNSPMLPSDLNGVGDGAGDTRIGYLDQNQAKLLLTPLDSIRERVVKRQALEWADEPIIWTDERTGLPVQVNSKSYPGMIPNPMFILGEWHDPKGSPVWQGLGTTRNYYATRYRPLMDGSHLPVPWVVPYLRTGHPALAHIGAYEAVSTIASQWNVQRNRRLDGVAYEGIQLVDGTQQVRGMGWAIRALGLADAMLADTDPVRPLIRDTLDDNARFAAAFPATVPAPLANLGALYEPDGNDVIGSGRGRPFFYSILFLCGAMEAWRGDRPGWAPYMAALAKWQVGLTAVDDGYYGALYTFGIQSERGLAHVFPSWRAAMAANYPQVPVPAPPGIGHDNGIMIPPGKVFQGERAFPQDVTSYYVLSMAALAAGANAGVPGAARAYAGMRARITTPPMVGPTWESRGRNGGPSQCYPAWAIVPA